MHGSDSRADEALGRSLPPRPRIGNARDERASRPRSPATWSSLTKSGNAEPAGGLSTSVVSTDPAILSEESVLAQGAFLRAIARALVAGEHDAEDVAQEAWVRAVERGATIRDPRPWLASVTRSLAHRLRRSTSRRSARERVAATAEALPSASDLAQREEARHRLARAVLEVPAPFRDVLVLRYLEGLGAIEIARRLDLPPATVRTRTKRGLDHLRERLDRGPGGRAAWCAALAPLATGGVEISLAALGGALVQWKLAGSVLFAAGAIVALGILVNGSGPDPVEHSPEPAAPAASVAGSSDDSATAPADLLATGSAREPAPDMPPPDAPAQQRVVAWRPPMRLRVTVLSPDGMPIERARVTLRPESRVRERFQAKEEAAGTTDSSGLVSFDAWPNGLPFQLDVEPTHALRFATSEFHPPVGVAEHAVVLRGTASGGVRGRLVSRAGGTPIQGHVSVFAAEWSERLRMPGVRVRSDESGQFEASGLVPGEWRVSACGLETSVASRRVRISTGSTTDAGEFALGSPVFLEGVVVEESGVPIAGVRVFAPARPDEAFVSSLPGEERRRRDPFGWDGTDASGRFRVRARGDGVEERITLRRGEWSRTFGPFVAPAFDLRLVWPNGANVSIRLRDPDSGNAVAEGQIEVRGRFDDPSAFLRALASSDAEGVFRFADLPAGALEIHVLYARSAPPGRSYASTVATLPIDPGAREIEHVVDLEVGVRRSIRARFVDEDDRPIAGLSITARTIGTDFGSGPVRVTDFDGRWQIDDAIPRHVELSSHATDLESWTREVRFEEASSIDLGTIVLRRLH